MKPYYDRDGTTIYHGDAREVLPTLGLQADLVLTDPPYGDTSLKWDRIVRGWPDAVAPFLKPTGSLWVFGSFKSHLVTAADFADWKLAQDVIWEKHNGSGLATDRFRRVHEIAVQWYRAEKWETVYKCPQFTNDATPRKILRRASGPSHMGGRDASVYVAELGGPRLMRSVIYARSMHRRAINETQKPIEVLVPLIEYSCPPGGLVLDLFAGSCSTLQAARLAGRQAIGIEMREEQCAAAVAGLSQAVLPLGVA